MPDYPNLSFQTYPYAVLCLLLKNLRKLADVWKYSKFRSNLPLEYTESFVF